VVAFLTDDSSPYITMAINHVYTSEHKERLGDALT